MKTPSKSETQTQVVATMHATAPGRAVDAQVHQSDRRFYLMVDGNLVHHETGSIAALVEQMAREIDRRLGRTTMFGLRASCESRNFSITYGSAKQQSVGGRPGTPIPCVEEAMENYDDSSLAVSLSHASMILKRCCR